MVRCAWWERTDRYSDFIDGVSSPIMRNMETGEELPSNKLPGGALYACDDYPESMRGADGLTVFCKLPEGTAWCIDGRANNCTMPEDKVHRCWVHHGTVGDKITADKNGHTCAAGAGSIAVPGYHGMLTDGELNP